MVTEAGPDVLPLRTGVLNVRVSARTPWTSAAPTPSPTTPARRPISSRCGTLDRRPAGRAVDRRIVGDNTYGQRNHVTNRMDFRRVVERWAELSIRGLNELKARAPINDAGQFAGAAP